MKIVIIVVFITLYSYETYCADSIVIDADKETPLQDIGSPDTKNIYGLINRPWDVDNGTFSKRSHHYKSTNGTTIDDSKTFQDKIESPGYKRINQFTFNEMFPQKIDSTVFNEVKSPTDISISSFGTHFVFAFPVFTTASNSHDLKLYALVSNQEDSVNNITFIQRQQTDDQTFEQNIDASLCENCNDVIMFNQSSWPEGPIYNTLIYVQSTGNISLNVGMFYKFIGSSFTVLPVNSLGTVYSITTGSASTEINTQRNAVIIIPLPSGTNYISEMHLEMYPTNVEFKNCEGKNENQTLLYPNIFTLTCFQDISGTVVKSDRPIAVLSGVMNNNNSDFYGFEMLLPINFWGTGFLLSNIINDASYVSRFKIVAYNDTILYMNCTSVTDLIGGEYYLYNQTGIFATFLYSLQPISVIRIDDCDISLSMFAQLPSLDHYLQTSMNLPVLDELNLENFAVVYQNGPILKISGSEIGLNKSSDFLVLHENKAYSNYIFNVEFKNYNLQHIQPFSSTSYSVIQYGRWNVSTVYGQVSGFTFNGISPKFQSLKNACPIVTTFSTPTTIDRKEFVITDVINNITTWPITNNDEVTKALEKLDIALAIANGSLTVSNIVNVTYVLCECANVTQLNDYNFFLYMDCYEKLLTQEESQIREAQAMNNTSLQLLICVQEMAFHTENANLFYNNATVAMSINETNCSNVKDDSGGLTIIQYSHENVTIVNDYSGSSSYNQITIFATLPYATLCIDSSSNAMLSAGLSSNKTLVKNSFLIYRNQKLFGSSLPHATITDSHCTVDDVPITNYVVTVKVLSNPKQVYNNLAHPISYGLKVGHEQDTLLHAETICATWYIKWNTAGCKVKSTEGNIYICECNHMSDYSVLVSNSAKDPSLCDKTLNTLGLVLTTLSAICLFLATVLTVLRKLSIFVTITFIDKLFDRSKNIKTVIGDTLMISLFMFFFLFTILSDKSTCSLSNYGCEVSGAILYTILMTTLFFAAFAGITYFKLYYVVFGHDYLNFFTSKIFVTFVSIGVPSIVTIILWFSTKDFFWRDDDFCWIRPTYVSFAVIIPTTVIILGDVILSGLLIKGFFFSKSKAIQSKKGRRKIIAKKILVLLTVQIVLGLPWVIQFFTIGFPYVTGFDYVFTLANGSQGIWLTIIYLYSFYRSLRKVEQTSQITKSSEMESTKNIKNISPKKEIEIPQRRQMLQ